MNDPSLSSFNKDPEIQIPPRLDLRNFNENDLMGDFNKDERGDNIIQSDSNGNLIDN